MYTAQLLHGQKKPSRITRRAIIEQKVIILVRLYIDRISISTVNHLVSRNSVFADT